MRPLNNKHISGNSFANVYGNLLDNLMHFPEFTSSPRGQQTKEITDITLEITDPTKCLYINKRRSSQLKYIAAELIWYFSGDRSVGYIDRYSKFWKQISTINKPFSENEISFLPNTKEEREDYYNQLVIKYGVVNSAYGDLIFKKKNQFDFSQYHWAFESLANDKDTRQAILHFNTPEHQYEDNRDFVCTLTGMFLIRDNKLNLTVTMRSNDAILGTPTDIPFFCTLQRHMLYHLKPLYPELELGVYRHKVHSMHVYERHFDLINDMLTHQFESGSLPSIDKPLINMDGSPTQTIKNLFEWANDDVREPIIGMMQDDFINFLTNNLITTDEQEN